MRISSLPDDPGFSTHRAMMEAGQKAAVFFNGERQNFCLMADDAEGEIVRLKRAPDGSFVVDPNDPATLLAETLKGRVRIAIVRPSLNPNALCAGIPAA